MYPRFGNMLQIFLIGIILQGQKISPAVARNRHSNVHVYLIPKFGDTKLNRITLAVFEDWLFKLPLSNSTKNHLLYTMRLIMKEAVRRGVIKDNPLEGIEPLDPACKTRDYLRIDELNRLFPKDVEEFAKLWGKDTGFGMTLLIAASGGLRSGELRALRWRHVVWETGGILVMRARKRIVGEGTPKANSVRGVLLPQRTLSLLHWWYEENNQPGPEVYISPVIGANSLLRAFRRGMEKANINTTGRYLDVHSLRHTYNTQMRGLLEESKLMAFTGHKSIKMLEHYDQKTVAEKLQRRAGLRGQVDQFFSE